jgi:transposase-like protein
MVLHDDNTKYIKKEILEMLSEGGFERLGEAIQILLNATMLAEREKYLGAGPYERTETRTGQANGFKSKTMKTRVGEIPLAVPQSRDGKFYPNCLEKGQRSEKALTLAIAEMYVQGVSTRKVMSITQELCGFDVSSSTVSKATAELDTLFRAWRERPLDCYPYVYLDARYEKVREGGVVIDQAVLVAVGVSESGRREVIGVSVELSEAEVHWRKFLQSLQQRGLHGVKLFVSDDHQGLKAARKAVFSSVPWQRCQFHLQQNAQKYVPREEMKAQVAVDIRNIFNAPDGKEAERLLNKTVVSYEKSAPKLSQWMAESLPEGLTVFALPAKHRTRTRTTNGVERLNKEIKRRTRVVSIFPNCASCLRLVTAVLMETSEDWQTDSSYLTFDQSEKQITKRTN